MDISSLLDIYCRTEIDMFDKLKEKIEFSLSHKEIEDINELYKTLISYITQKYILKDYI